MSLGRWPQVWQIVQRTGKTLLWAVALIAVAIAANLVGIYFVGSIAGCNSG